MLRLLLLRHAEAAPAARASDLDRRLTPGGKAGAARFGAYMQATGLAPDLTLVSPARRALETLGEIEQALSRPLPPSVKAPALYNAKRPTITALIAETPPAVGVLLIIGHNPGLAETAVALARHGDCANLARVRAQFPAPCLAIIDFDEGDWRTASCGEGRLARFLT
ncbi:MAG: SixA phosphatase family protein, partial [Roseiarcus sp.]